MKKEILDKLSVIERNSLLAAKQMLTLDDVVSLTGLSKSHLYKLTSQKKIPFYRPGGKTMYFDKNEIETWLKQNRVASEAEINARATEYIVTGK